MLPGLSSLEVARLQMSVGYGTHKRGRPLSPVEVGRLLRRTQSAGASLQDCAEFLKLSKDQTSRFLRVLELPEDLMHLVEFGRSADSKIGFTTAVQLARMTDRESQRVVASAILEQELQTDELRQVIQLQKRSRRSMKECLKEVIAMRPTVERHYVFIGAVGEERVETILAEMAQSERDALLRSGIDALDLQGTSGRLGEKIFTLVGDERLNGALISQGEDTIEVRLRTNIMAKVESR